MKAYSLHDREVGYCQGSGFIVGLLLMQMPEEEAFAVFVKIMQDYKMRDMFKPTMAELGLCMYQLENLVQVCLKIILFNYYKMCLLYVCVQVMYSIFLSGSHSRTFCTFPITKLPY